MERVGTVVPQLVRLGIQHLAITILGVCEYCTFEQNMNLPSILMSVTPQVNSKEEIVKVRK